jgi:hypothetical protein
MVRLRGMLAVVPAEARIVASLDLERLRGLPIWKDLASGPAKEAAVLLDGFTKGTGIDLFTQLRQIVVAVPGRREPDDRYVVVALLANLDPHRVLAWFHQHQPANTITFMHGANTLVHAKGAWAQRAESLAKTRGATNSVTADPELRRLCERAAKNHPLWIASIVPLRIRHALIEQIRFPELASLARVWGFLDADRGLHAEMVAELSNATDARGLAHRLASYLNAVKRDPDMLASGLSPYIEATRLGARGPNLHATLDLPESHTGDLTSRLRDLLRATWTRAASPP